MPAVPTYVLEPIWEQFKALIPEHVDTHPTGGHRPRIADRLVFDRLVQMLVFGVSYQKIADHRVSATTLRRRRDEWIGAGVFHELEQAVLLAYDKIIGLKLGDLAVDGCIAKAPCGGEVAGPSPVDRGKGGMKRSLLVGGNGIPLGVVVAPANRNDGKLLRTTLEKLSRFGFDLPERITVHLDAGYDSWATRDLLEELGCEYVISKRGTPLQAGKRWTVERTHSWHNNFGKLLRMTERKAAAAEAWVQLANAIITFKRLIADAWETFRWNGRLKKKPKEWR